MIEFRFQRALLFIFIFLNLFNPISVFLTFFFNAILSLVILLSACFALPKRVVIFVFVPVVLFLIVSIVSILTGNIDSYVIGKYFRTFLSYGLLAFIALSIKFKSCDLLSALRFCFVSHVFIILLQVIDPTVSDFTARFLGMPDAIRDVILSDYKFRVLGLTQSYDTASLISALSAVFFLLHRLHLRSLSSLILGALSLLACFFSSRMGMLLGLSIGLIYLAVAFFDANFIGRLSVIASLWLSFYFLHNTVYPILANAFGLSDYIIASERFSEYGGSGTIDALLGSHLEVFSGFSIVEWLFGRAVDPDGTDIGYVKIIHHVGVFGLAFIISSYFLFMSLSKCAFRNVDINVAILSRFLFVAISLVLVVNFKSLEIYSRGVGDFILLLTSMLYGTQRCIGSRVI